MNEGVINYELSMGLSWPNDVVASALLPQLGLST